MDIVVKKLSDLHPTECNSRIHPEKQIAELKRSLEKNGQTRLLVIDEENTIWIGNGLYQAMVDLGYGEAYCIIKAGMSEADKKKMMLSDNKIFDLGLDDMDALADIVQGLDGDLDVPGYDAGLLEAFLSDLQDIEPVECLADDDDLDGFNIAAVSADDTGEDNCHVAETLPAVPRSSYGQVYQLGKHRLMCGDSTNMADVLKLMDGAQAQLLLTDPPYNVDYEGESGSIANDNMSERDFRVFLHKAFKAANHVMRPGAAFYIWHADSHGFIFRDVCERIGWPVRQCLVWVKNTHVLGRQDYQWQHEPCLYGWKDGASHIWAGGRKQTTVFNVAKPQKSTLHPTMKPIELFSAQINNSARPGDIVLDLFAGSGTTLMAAEQSDRIAYCMEYDPRFVDIIIDRWQILTGQKAVLVGDARLQAA